MAFDYSNTDFGVDFSDRESCLTFVEDSLSPYGLDVPTDAAVTLELNSGIDQDGVRVYRPYVYMASVLSRAVNTTHLNRGSAGPVSGDFRDADKTIAAWLAEQAAKDAGFGLALPNGAAVTTGSIPRSTSVPTVVVF